MTRKSNPYEFGQLVKAQKKKHKRSSTEEHSSMLETFNDQYHLKKIKADLKGTLNTNIKKYKNLLKNKIFDRNSEVTASIDNIHIQMENKTTRNQAKTKTSLPKSYKNKHSKIQKSPVGKLPKMRMEVKTVVRRLNNKSVQKFNKIKTLSPNKAKTIDREKKGRSVAKRSIDKERSSKDWNSNLIYKPYTIRDYKSNFEGKIENNQGGLGPNIDIK
mmetsp:Transcript_13120/g.11598  ORF Transcript_13120/g.11598 Transcript_13120/m.11598 type:complete len:216 (-) Transcript_13120:24-671(-)